MRIPTARLVYIYFRQTPKIYIVRATLTIQLHQKKKKFSFHTEKLVTVDYFFRFSFKEDKTQTHTKNCQTARSKNSCTAFWFVMDPYRVFVSHRSRSLLLTHLSLQCVKSWQYPEWTTASLQPDFPCLARPGTQKNTTQLAAGTIKHNTAGAATGAGEETMAGFLPCNLCL